MFDGFLWCTVVGVEGESAGSWVARLQAFHLCFKQNRLAFICVSCWTAIWTELEAGISNLLLFCTKCGWFSSNSSWKWKTIILNFFPSQKGRGLINENRRVEFKRRQYYCVGTFWWLYQRCMLTFVSGFRSSGWVLPCERWWVLKQTICQPLPRWLQPLLLSLDSRHQFRRCGKSRAWVTVCLPERSPKPTSASLHRL